jgi:hypothetical protein
MTRLSATCQWDDFPRKVKKLKRLIGRSVVHGQHSGASPRRHAELSCQAVARSTRPLPPVVHRVRSGPHRARPGVRLRRDQTRPRSRPRVCRFEKACEGTTASAISSTFMCRSIAGMDSRLRRALQDCPAKLTVLVRGLSRHNLDGHTTNRGTCGRCHPNITLTENAVPRKPGSNLHCFETSGPLGSQPSLTAFVRYRSAPPGDRFSDGLVAPVHARRADPLENRAAYCRAVLAQEHRVPAEAIDAKVKDLAAKRLAGLAQRSRKARGASAREIKGC